MDVLAAGDRSTCFTAVKDIVNGGMQRKESTEKDRNETGVQESPGVSNDQRGPSGTDQHQPPHHRRRRHIWGEKRTKARLNSSQY